MDGEAETIHIGLERKLQFCCIQTALMFKEWGVSTDTIEEFLKKITWAPWKFHDHPDPLNAPAAISFHEAPDCFMLRSPDHPLALTELRRSAQRMIKYIIQETNEYVPRITDYDYAEYLANQLNNLIWEAGYQQNQKGNFIKRKTRLL